MAFQKLLRVRTVKHVEQNAFHGGVSHRGFPGCVDGSMRYDSTSLRVPQGEKSKDVREQDKMHWTPMLQQYWKAKSQSDQPPAQDPRQQRGEWKTGEVCTVVRRF